MNDNDASPDGTSPRRPAWNKGKLVGPKPPLRQGHVWSIRTTLKLEGRTRDLALFNLAIDSKLRGCDVVAVRVDDVAPNGYTLDRATVRQKKTRRPVRFELTEQTLVAIDDHLRETGRGPGQFLFAGRGPSAPGFRETGKFRGKCDMIVTIVTFRLARAHTLEEITATFKSTAPKYQSVPGLLRKNYFLSEDGRRAGGIYVWASRADADLLYTPEWKAFVEGKYGAAPEIEHLHSPVMVDNRDASIVVG